MRLQMKVTLAMLLAVALITFTNAAVLWYAIYPSYLALEEDEAERNIARVHSVLDEDVATLARTVTDWAAWDDTYLFVGGRKPAFVQDNLTATALANLSVNLLYAEDTARRPVLTTSFDRAEGTVDTAALDGVGTFAAAARPLIERAWGAGEASGLVLADGRLFMAAARGIQPSDRGSPANGVLVFARAVDDEVAESLRRRVRLPIAFGAPLPAGAPAEDMALTRTGDTIIAASVLRDVDRSPLLTFHAEMPRSIELLGSRTLLVAALSLVLSAVLILFLLWVALRRIIVRPIQDLTVRLAPVGHAGPAGTDEIGALAAALARHVELQRALVEADAARRVAEEANRTKSMFLAQMSHELRTPLHAVLGFAEIMEQQLLGPLSDPYRDSASRIRTSGTHLLNLINDILDLSRVEAGEFKVVAEPVDVAAVLEESVQLARELPGSGALTLDTAIPAGLPWLTADTRRLRQVVLNLLSNAVKFTPEGGRVTLRAMADSTGLAVSVQDTGVGIAPEHLETVLRPFGQIDNSQTRKHDGAGLGLPLAREFTRLMGGTLSIASTPGTGTTVTVAFPRDRLLVERKSA